MTVTALRAPARAVPAVPAVPSGAQGTLALDLRQSWEPPAARALGRLDPDAYGDHRDPVVVVPHGRAADLDAVAQGFARALVEVLGGDRGAGQLLSWATPEVFAQLQRRSEVLTDTVPADRRVRRLRSRVAGVRVCCPATGVAELSIHLRRGERSHAVAARLEHRVQRRRGRLGAAWMCVALEIG